ncbi:MAG TPA: glycosyltransferase [Acidobacteriaceae bacterium]|nr:glycosyltransferase [Acidobacteriaceae bacterium]
MKTAQFLLTRFNPAVSFASEDLGIDPGWLTHRFDLFEKICLPSVAGQSERNYHWLLMVSERTPPKFMKRLMADLATVSLPTAILLVPEYSEQAFNAAILTRLDAAVDRVVTTRLDNDDGIARDYLAYVRAEAAGLPAKGDFVLNFRQGAQVAQDGIFPRDARLNPFLSVVSSPRKLRTAFATHHGKMNTVGKVIDKRGGNAHWIQVIHPRNALNRLHERKPCSEAYLANFSLAKNWTSCL